ncbi:phosphatidylinositide phosphatase SAC2 isoform X2 [Cylas formicarius]|uniref:phosphatidylinositide phosphatase SAC2 isoform X2 n=1 Tax=Cylas formicarius TaxID=197179 RepID=UPI002958B8E3|nr:phosphatidylinositide phosphatase SAC2 isoform X2 [Cylas formicarius]
MELFRTAEFYIFVKDQHSLWWDRQTGAFIPKTGWDLTDAEDPVCLGIFHGIIGKVEYNPLFDPRLLLIKESVLVGKLHGNNEVYKIKSVVFLPLNQENIELNLKPCSKHKTINIKKANNTNSFMDIQKTTLSKTWGTLKSAGNTIKNTTQHAAAIASGIPKRDTKLKEKFEKQIVEEFYKIFNDTNSFYYSFTTDLTNSLQRHCHLEKHNMVDPKALWKTAEDKFFWNKHMLQSILDTENNLCDPWILPIIQGYIQIEDCKVELGPFVGEPVEKQFEIFSLCILSRRSRFRAGTRYKRRGVDEEGEVANYVETEQIITYQTHEVSFLQVRGSVPVFWSQPGYKYRPPPRLDKGEPDTCIAFQKHFNKEIQKYGPVCAINLIDQTGKEKVIFDAYSHHMLLMDSPFITYVTFDFHEYCRGMHFENVSILINAVADVIKDMNYCWRDKQGHICSQNGVFRVNCMDCLDRTNVVQTALGKAVMEIQFCKLGLVAPEGEIPNNIKSTFQLLWANNGDIISKQYAGTNALKGDYTRTGERKFTGIMKDGMNSANRYYLSRFKDSTRQGTIDIMLGNYVSEDAFNESKAAQFEEDMMATAEHVKLLIEDCKKMLINQPEMVVGAWGLINADPSTGDPSETDMDSIVILTRDSYFVADYDDQVDKVTNYQEVELADITLIEFGVPESSNSLFRTNKNKYCIRINYKINGVTGYYHMYRSANLRFFNNMAVVIKTVEEEVESLKTICEAFVVAIEIAGLPFVPFKSGEALDRRKSRVLRNKTNNSSIYLDLVNLPQITRNVSETQLSAIKSAGSKAFSNMTQQFSKLNKLSFKHNKLKEPHFTIGLQSKHDTSSDSEDEYENSIFQPSISAESGNSLQYPTDSSSGSIEQGHECIEDSVLANQDSFLPSVGIVMGQKNETTPQATLENKQNLLTRMDSSQLDQMQLSSIVQNVSINNVNQTPEIQLNFEQLETAESKMEPPKTLNLDRKISHSSGEVDDPSSIVEYKHIDHSSSECDVQMNISQSQSESALKNKLGNIASPVTSATKELFSPLTKLAKEVQNFGANLDPRKLSGTVRQVTERDMEEHRKLQERWVNSKTRLIAL